MDTQYFITNCEQYAEDDSAAIVDIASRYGKVNVELVSDIRIHEHQGLCIAEASFDVNNTTVLFRWGYDSYQDGNGNDFIELVTECNESATENSLAAALLRKARIKTNISSSTQIMAAENDELLDEDDSFSETLDDMSDQIDDIQDTVDDAVEEDDVDIETDNNIEDHYIAECERCQGVFISAVIENDQKPEKVTGVCPLCGKESDQYLKWVIHTVK